MRDTLAERILAEVMEWNAEDLARELPYLQAISSIKYDEYQQFSPGMRFLESLAMWLDQFRTKDEKEIAYALVRSRLVFISNAELYHLVTISYPDLIRPFLLRRVAARLSVSEVLVKRIIMSPEFRILLRQCLFMGLTEGAHLDIFRRTNPDISHEQFLLSYDISEEKSKNILQKLRSDLQQIAGHDVDDADSRFNDIILIDDFSASGLSYFRRNSDGTYGGKIVKILKAIFFENGNFHDLVKRDNLQISILLYVATQKARIHLQTMIDDWFRENNIPGKPKVFVAQELTDEICVRDDVDKELTELLKKYFDDSVQDEHYRVGKHQKPYLGFDECALPLILSHNTPNNSIPILWLDSSRKYIGLFPRISRHREVVR